MQSSNPTQTHLLLEHAPPPRGQVPPGKKPETLQSFLDLFSIVLPRTDCKQLLWKGKAGVGFQEERLETQEGWFVL